jgi:hypothetical protein
MCIKSILILIMERNSIFNFDAPTFINFNKNNKEQDNSDLEINPEKDKWFFHEHFLHFKTETRKKKKIQRNKSCIVTIKVSLNPQKNKISCDPSTFNKNSYYKSKTTIINKIKSSSTISMISQNQPIKRIPKKKDIVRNNIKINRKERKEQKKENQSKIKNVSKNKLPKKTENNMEFLYEPQLFSKKITKSYEKIKGIKWHELDMSGRRLANKEIKEFLRKNVF